MSVIRADSLLLLLLPNETSQRVKMSQASSSTELCTVVVCELPATVTSSEIECYFRSSRSGGGDVEEVVFQSSIPGCAHVVFEDEDGKVTLPA